MRLPALMFTLSALWATGLTTAQAHAGNVARAQAAFDEGKRHLAEGRLDEACRSFEASVREEPGLGARFKLAECHEKQGRFASAFTGFLEVAKAARERKQTAREHVARDRAAALEKRIARLVVVVDTDATGIEVLRDDEPLARAKWGVPQPVDPGTFLVRARAPGFVTWEQSVTVSLEGSSSTVVVPPLTRTTPREARAQVALATAAAPESAALPAEASAAPTPARRSLTGGRIGALITGGMGVAALAGGAVIGTRALSTNSKSSAHCIENACDAEGVALRDRALADASVSTWLLAGGSALVVGSVALWFLSPPKTSTTTQIGFVPNLRGGAVVARASW